MAWFRKKSTERESGESVADEVRAIAMVRFHAHGMPVRVLDGTSGVDTVLVGEADTSYPLHNLIARAAAGPPDGVLDLVTAHVDGLVAAASTPDSNALSDAEWLDLVRVRLMPSAAATELGAGYARTIAGDFAVMICLDFPTHISYLSDGNLGGHDPDALASTGLASVMDESTDVATEVRPSIWLVAGDSPYTATKVLGMQHLIGSVLPAAPNGVLFGVPHRHAIVAHPVLGADAMDAISPLATVVIASAVDDAPGGALSTSLYYWHEGVIDLVAWFADDGGMHVDGSGRFGEMLSSLGG